MQAGLLLFPVSAAGLSCGDSLFIRPSSPRALGAGTRRIFRVRFLQSQSARSRHGAFLRGAEKTNRSRLRACRR